MLDGVFEFIGEFIVEGILEGVFNAFFNGIKGHPYLTCIYRGFIIGIIFLIVLVIWHLMEGMPFSFTIAPDIILSFYVGLATTIFLSIVELLI